MGQNQGRPFFTRSSVRWQPTESKLTSTVYTVDVDVDVDVDVVVVVFVFVFVFVGSYGFSDFAITGVAEVAFVVIFFIVVMLFLVVFVIIVLWLLCCCRRPLHCCY